MMSEPEQDVFISHASADKTDYVNPLTDALTVKEITFWLDDVEIGWGDSVVGKINEGLRSSQFALLCLSHNFLQRPWPESEMAAVLSIQNTTNVKRVLPLILNSKEEVLKQYPLIAGLAYREFDYGPDNIVSEIEKMVKSVDKTADEISVTVEGVHTGKLCHLRVPRRASVKWLAKKAQSGLDVREALRIGSFGEFIVRWILVDVDAEHEWMMMSRQKKREIHAVVASETGPSVAYSGLRRLEEIGVRDGTVFHLYAIEDEEYDPPVAPCSPPP